MTFFEHLAELRKRIINSLYAIGIGAFVGVYLAPKLIHFINEPMQKALIAAGYSDKLYYNHPAGAVNLVITLGVYLGMVIASPVVLYQIWLFVAPALYKHERSAVTGFLFSTVFLFLAGIAFGYFITLPYILRFLVSFQNFGGTVAPLLSINEYFDLILMILLGLGLVFELPILIFFLTLFGIVTPKFLWANFRYAILIIAIVAAVITPTPDATTMLIFMAPMVGLYFVGILVSAIVVRNKRKGKRLRGRGLRRDGRQTKGTCGRSACATKKKQIPRAAPFKVQSKRDDRFCEAQSFGAPRCYAPTALAFLRRMDPALGVWANVCRASGAGLLADADDWMQAAAGGDRETAVYERGGGGWGGGIGIDESSGAGDGGRI